MRNILISIKPEWVEKILNREKTIEIRKSMPKCELPCKVYIYCTQGKHDNWLRKYPFSIKESFYQLCDDNFNCLNGKVIAEFTLNRIDFLIDVGFGIHYVDKELKDLDLDFLRTNSCLTDEQIYFYLGLKKDSGYYNDGYVWHIDDLIIYDKPKELDEFSVYIPNNKCEKHEQGFNCEKCDYYIKQYRTCGSCYYLYRKLKRPPQSWCYVEGE